MFEDDPTRKAVLAMFRPLTVNEAAEALRLCTQSVRTLLKKGRLKGYQMRYRGVHSRVMIPAWSIQEYQRARVAECAIAVYGRLCPKRIAPCKKSTGVEGEKGAD